MLITIARRARWMNASKHRADVEQLARILNTFARRLLVVFRSCKRGINDTMCSMCPTWPSGQGEI